MQTYRNGILFILLKELLYLTIITRYLVLMLFTANFMSNVPSVKSLGTSKTCFRAIIQTMHRSPRLSDKHVLRIIYTTGRNQYNQEQPKIFNPEHTPRAKNQI